MSDLRDRLQQSVDNRAAMMKRFGVIPLSILRLSRGQSSRNMFRYQGENRERSSVKSDAVKSKRQALADVGYAGAKSSPSNGGNGRGKEGVSIMPAELVEFFVRYYAKPGDVYLDPFMGQGVQMQVAHAMGLHYYGYDLSTDFCSYIEGVRSRIDDGTTTIQTTHGDSVNPSEIPDGIGDFSFHSPPYWDIEFYGAESGQLGYNKTYKEFLLGMEQVARAWLPKFKQGAYHVVNVNDFRKDGAFYPYHADTIALFQRAGWVIVDTWIIDSIVASLPRAFAVDFNLQRIAPKVHEYGLVFRKP